MEINIEELKKIAKQAGKAILEVYENESDFNIEYKKDASFKEGVSPLTKADLISNEIITKSLKKIYPLIPILSEESKEIPYEKRRNWEYLWIIDPLDGTKEFIKRNGEFTVNIALIKNKKPVLGVIYVPVKDLFYYTENGSAFKQKGDKKPVKLPLNEKRKSLIIVASRSNRDLETNQFVKKVRKKQKVRVISVGSSLKLCFIAEGKVDIYPKIGPTKEWDIAAGHAIVNASGKKVFQYGKDEELVYNKENLLNPNFITMQKNLEYLRSSIHKE